MPVLLIAGLISLVLGLVLFFAWFGFIVAIIKAILPAAFIGAGAVAAYLGWEEIKDQKGPNIDFSSPAEANRYKAEAMAYQEEINEVAIPAETEGGGKPGEIVDDNKTESEPATAPENSEEEKPKD